MSYFDFTRLIQKYTVPFVLLVKTGQYVDGEWVETETRAAEQGAIISFAQSKILRSGGTITSKDLHLFMNHAIPDALKAAQIRYNGALYNIEVETENAQFTGVYSYVLRYVSVFDGGGTDDTEHP